MQTIQDYSSCKFELIESLGGLIYLDSNNTTSMNSKTPYKDSYYGHLVKKIDAYELFENEHGLEKFNIIIFPYDIDQILLYDNKNQIKNFLDSGGIVLNFTQTYLEYIPKLPFYVASKTPIKDRNILTTEHFITKGVKDYDISYRRGVKGFFSRGSIKAPSEAEIFLKDSDGGCVGYADSTSTKGLIVHTAGADLLGFGLFESSTAKRLGLNLLLWIEEYLKERQ